MTTPATRADREAAIHLAELVVPGFCAGESVWDWAATGTNQSGCGLPREVSDILSALATARAEGAAEERAECAKVANARARQHRGRASYARSEASPKTGDHYDELEEECKRIATSIRKRGDAREGE